MVAAVFEFILTTLLFKNWKSRFIKICPMTFATIFINKNYLCNPYAAPGVVEDHVNYTKTNILYYFHFKYFLETKICLELMKIILNSDYKWFYKN